MSDIKRQPAGATGARSTQTATPSKTDAKTTIRRAGASDRAGIAALLEQSGLPARQLDDLSLFLVAQQDGVIVGCGGLERHGRSAVARSLAVRPDRRRQGIADQLLAETVRLAREENLEALFGLVHQPALGLVRRYGFELIPRQEAPAEILGSWQFQSCCCDSAPCFRLILRAAP